MRESASVSLRICAEVPESYVVGGPGAFDRIVSESFGPYAHLGWAAAWLGAAAECSQRLIDEIRSARPLREKVMGNDLSLARLAEARSDLDAVHDCIERVIGAYERGEAETAGLTAVWVNDLKVVSSTRCLSAVNKMMEIGGLQHGYMRASRTRIERTFRDLRSASMNFSNDRLVTANGKCWSCVAGSTAW